MLSYDIEAAKAELAKSGYPNGFDTRSSSPRGNQVWAQTAQILQAGMKQIGINVTINQKDHAAYENDFRAFDYDMMINNAINDISDPDEMASFQCDAENGGSDSFWTGYNNPEVVEARARGGRGDGLRQARRDVRADPGDGRAGRAVRGADLPAVDLRATRRRSTASRVNPAGAYTLESVWLA